MNRVEAKAITMSALLNRIRAVIHGFNDDDRYKAYKEMLKPESGWTVVSIEKDGHLAYLYAALGEEVHYPQEDTWVRVSLTRKEPNGVCGTYFCVKL